MLGSTIGISSKMEKGPQPLIPTRHKGPLAKGTSFPVGAELVSRELAGVPQYDSLEIGFYGEKNPALLLTRNSSPILRFDYRMIQGSYSTCNSSWSQSWLGPNWKITVYPMLSSERAKFRDYLDVKGWGLIRDWLTRQWPINGRLGSASLIFAACDDSEGFKEIAEESLMPAKP